MVSIQLIRLLWNIFLKETSSYKLVYKESDNPELFQTYSDTSHSGCKGSSCSTGGYTTIVCSGVG